MSFFNPEIPNKQEPHSKHPWEHRIKAKFSGTFRYSHNSVENPLYPLPWTENVLDTKPVKFTVIGNMVTKEFIYCLHLVRGLHKYRKMEFEAPVIRGVTSVEWPKVWNDLKLHFGTEVHCIKSQVAVLINNQFLGGENELKNVIESKYVYHYPESLDYYKEGIEQFSNYIKSNGRPCAYLHISINDIPIGPLILMLYADIVPLTCQNFIKLCELTRGGYAGTPIHRIVQDSWIQCGGFTLKNPVEMDCENYIVPHDRRGVVGMANAGRNEDCSSQFFILLQPAHWMKHKYVAFGQLIEGERTLKKIEEVPTWYESPTAKITIYKAGVFNMECQWRPINKTTTDYISGHIEDLLLLGTILFETLLEKVYAVIEEKKKAEEDLLAEAAEEEKQGKDIRSTQRFRRNKEDIAKELKNRASSGITSSAYSGVKNNFDVEVYVEYELEEEIFPDESIMTVPYGTPKSSKVLEQLYYLPLTDVPYPGEVESTFNLQKLLRGDYCLETDLLKDRDERKQMSVKNKQCITIPDDLLDALFECFEPDEDQSDSFSESDDERKIQEYIKENVDTVSFAGPAIKKIANMQDKYKILQDTQERKKKFMYADEDLRLLRVAAKKLQTVERKKVSISKDTAVTSHTRIHRRQTGFVRPEEIDKLEETLEKLKENNEIEDIESERLRQVVLEVTKSGRGLTNRYQTGYESSLEVKSMRRSALLRLYNEVSSEDLKPTLKNLSERSKSRESNHFAYLTHSLLNPKESKDKLFISRHPERRQRGEDSIDLQHGQKLTRKVSSDYVKTLNVFDEVAKCSIRSIEYARNRPSISVVEYKMLNQKYQDELKASKEQLGEFLALA